MRTKLIILVLQTLKHFNDVLRNVEASYCASDSRLEKDADNIGRKLNEEIKHQESKLVK